MLDKEILSKLIKHFGSKIYDFLPFPKPYTDKIKNPKAILLGCDPTNLKYDIRFEYVFALERKHKEFNRFLSVWDKNLKSIGLSFNTIYTQNLCRNYFKQETSKNKIWYEVAEFWIPILKEELMQFDRNIPVLLSSEMIYKALLINKNDYIKPMNFYECKIDIPIPSELNKLERPLIPFYRHPKYLIIRKIYAPYRQKIKIVLKTF